MADTNVVSKAARFDRQQFLHDFTLASDLLGAPYSKESIMSSLAAFDTHLDKSSIVLRCTSRVGDVLNFRIFFRERVDTIEIARNHKFLAANVPLTKVIESWSAMYQGDSEQWCDFSPVTGLAKTWIHFLKLRPVEEILGIPELPACIQAHIPVLTELGLTKVCFSAVDYHGHSINVYFLASPQATPEQAAKVTALSGCEPPTKQELADMHEMVGAGSAFAVTMDVKTGCITRVAFYALEVPKLPNMGEKLTKFYELMPTYEEKKTSIVSWSYGRGNSKYMKGELGYAGEFSKLLAGMMAGYH